MGIGRGGRVSAKDRAECLELINEAVASGARKIKACEILEINIRTIERWEQNLTDRRCGPNSQPANSLTQSEQQQVVEIANSAEFANLPPSQIVPKLADQGIYIASESTFYRILRQKKLLAHRLKSNPRQVQRPEELVASAPNTVWSWDITYLKAAVKGRYYFLYLPMDIYSRKIVHWKIYEHESAENAAEMISEACTINNISSSDRSKLKLHSDNGGPMKGATMLATLQRLQIAPSFSRPGVSNDNPFSESLFKTLKYCPSFPERGFASIFETRIWVEKFVYWYNNVHQHSAISFVTPSARHSGEDIAILEKRKQVYEQAKLQRPERWSKNTRNWSRINATQLNCRSHRPKAA